MSAQRYAFGEYTLDLGRGALLRAGVDVKLRPKSYEVLRLLIERHGQLVSKDELLEAVWPRVVVTEGSLTQCLVDIRRALGDESQTVIRTIPRRGYMFDAPLIEADPGVRDGAPTLPVESSPPTVDPPALVAGGSAPARPRWLALALIGFGCVAVSLAWFAITRRDASEPAAMPSSSASRSPHNSIAVLPFVNMSADADQEYFSDGISEEILNLLARTPGLRVVARTSSFSFKGRAADVAEIAAKLNVAYVVEGSVRKSGDRLRITAQLIDAATSSHVWSEVYDRAAQDAFAVQIDIATQVAEALEATLTTERLADGSVPPSAEAHENFLRARYFFNRRAPGDLDLARRYFEETLRLDPRYARAWSGLAGIYGIEVSEGAVPVDVGTEKRRDAVEKALALDPGLAEAHARAAVLFWETGDGERAARHAARAYELDREEPLVLSHFCTLLAWNDRFDAALELDRRMIERDPVSLMARINYANTLIAAGRLDEAREEFQMAAELNRDWRPAVDVELARIEIVQGHYQEALDRIQGWSPGDDQEAGFALVYGALDRKAEAAAALQHLHDGAGPGSAVRLAEVYAHRGDVDAAFAWIATAYERMGSRPWLSSEWQWLYPLRFSPFLRPLQSDPRWAPLLARGLPPGTETVVRALPETLGIEALDVTTSAP